MRMIIENSYENPNIFLSHKNENRRRRGRWYGVVTSAVCGHGSAGGAGRGEWMVAGWTFATECTEF